MNLQLTLLMFASICVATSCASKVVGGRPDLPLSSRDGTSATLPAGVDPIVSSLQKAFANRRYLGLSLDTSVEGAPLIPGWHKTNGFVLTTFHEPITKVPLNRSKDIWVPYIAYFHIVLKPLGDRKTEVRVHTILSEVIDGEEPGLHGGKANHYRKVPPVRDQEEKVLRRIQQALEGSAS